jgi:hypothetical protein
MTTNYTHSVKAKLLSLSKQKNIQYQQLLTRFLADIGKKGYICSVIIDKTCR